VRLIGINGFKTSGKDTTFRIVEDLLEDQIVERRAFADKLKIMAAKALGYEGSSNADLIALMDEFKENGWISVGAGVYADKRITGREYLQLFGAHARDVFGDTFWIDQVLPDPAVLEGWDPPIVHVERAYPKVDVLCVTDVRYPNEAERVKRLGGEVWRIERPGLESDGHSSETPLPAPLSDITIRNDGDLDDLRDKVREALAC
jgi:hypothetical protein